MDICWKEKTLTLTLILRYDLLLMEAEFYDIEPLLRSIRNARHQFDVVSIHVDGLDFHTTLKTLQVSRKIYAIISVCFNLFLRRYGHVASRILLRMSMK